MRLGARNSLGAIGLPLRAGLHTGEIEIRDRDIGGIAVHAAARVMAQSQPSEVLVSRVVTDLVAGAGLKFSERGSRTQGTSGSMGLIRCEYVGCRRFALSALNCCMSCGKRPVPGN